MLHLYRSTLSCDYSSNFSIFLLDSVIGRAGSSPSFPALSRGTRDYRLSVEILCAYVFINMHLGPSTEYCLSPRLIFILMLSLLLTYETPSTLLPSSATVPIKLVSSSSVGHAIAYLHGVVHFVPRIENSPELSNIFSFLIAEIIVFLAVFVPILESYFPPDPKNMSTDFFLLCSYDKEVWPKRFSDKPC